MTSPIETVLCFDFGLKYIGVAVGFPKTGIANALLSLKAKQGEPHWQAIQALIQDWRPQALLLGIPLNMDGSAQAMTHLAEVFGEKLAEKTQLPVIRLDERLSSWEARHRLREQSVDLSKLSKEKLDKLNATAALVLLEQWLSDNRANHAH